MHSYMVDFDQAVLLRSHIEHTVLSPSYFSEITTNHISYLFEMIMIIMYPGTLAFVFSTSSFQLCRNKIGYKQLNIILMICQK